MEKQKAVIVYSGGMDSTTLLYDFKNQGYDLTAITFNYGSKHNHREIECAMYNCKKLKIPHQVIGLHFIKDLFKSSLLQGQGKIPHGHYEDASQKQTVVPFRNGIMLSIAVGYAESIRASKVLIASHKGDFAIYPDCRQEFNVAFKDAARNGTYNHVEVSMPYQNVNKTDIARIGRKLGVDYNNTWTCYDPQPDGKPCGRCGACCERNEALQATSMLYEDKK